MADAVLSGAVQSQDMTPLLTRGCGSSRVSVLAQPTHLAPAIFSPCTSHLFALCPHVAPGLQRPAHACRDVPHPCIIAFPDLHLSPSLAALRRT